MPVMIRTFPDSMLVEGEWTQPGPPVDIEARMTIQPLVGKELMNRPEGQRTKRLMKGYSDFELKTAIDKGDIRRKAQQVFYDGVWFEVQTSELWKDGIQSLDHWKVILAEMNEG